MKQNYGKKKKNHPFNSTCGANPHNRYTLKTCCIYTHCKQIHKNCLHCEKMQPVFFFLNVFALRICSMCAIKQMKIFEI